MRVERKDFGRTPAGEAVELFTLATEKGGRVELTNYGARLVSWWTPDRTGGQKDVLLGHDSLEPYLDDTAYLGAMVGRFANRIGGARFTLNNREYALDRNHGKHQLHGGTGGWHAKVWQAEVLETAEGPAVRLSIESPHLDQGFPGDMRAIVTYTLDREGGLRMDCRAQADQDTVVNIINHAYFNLSGDPARDCMDHELRIPASRYLPTDSEQIPTGEMTPVAGTPMDFTRAATIGSRINEDFAQLKPGKGYDHNWIIDRQGQEQGLATAAIARCPDSGIRLEVLTTQPGIQFYSGNFLDGSRMGKKGVPLGWRTGFCLEAQAFPDAPNHENFPRAVLRKGEVYEQTTVYGLSLSDET